MKSIREIAMLSGVSIATVSRYVNKTSNVSTKSAAKIQKVIDEHGYIPNKLTQAILENDSKMIGLIVENVVNPFFPLLLNEIGARIDNLGYTLVVCNTHGDLESEKNFVKKLIEIRSSGLIVVNTLDPNIYTNLNIPIVSVERKIENSSFIVSNNKEGARLATMSLINANRKNLLYISDIHLNEVAQIRKNKFEEVCNSNNINYNFLNKSLLDLTFSDLKDFDGIFCWNDLTAHKVISILKNHQITIPNDISIVGFDNIELNNLFEYELSTIKQDLQRIGRECIHLLLDIINNNNNQDLIIDIEYVSGNTV